MVNNEKKTHWQLFSSIVMKFMFLDFVFPFLKFILRKSINVMVKNILCSVICHREIENILIVQQ